MDMLKFLRDITSKLADKAAFVSFCADHHVNAGALIRRLRRHFHGPSFHGSWWWAAGIQGEFPAPPAFTQRA